MLLNMILFAYIAVTILYLEQCVAFDNVSGYYSWSEGNRTELYCPNECLSDDHPDRCCACDARRCWDVTPDDCPISSLQLEYIDIYGNGVIVGSNNATYIKLEHTNGKLTKVPDDICSFSDQLVILDLRDNHLTDVSSLQCLYKLDTLRLDNNLITELENTTFAKMRDLRVLTFKNNLVKSLSPNVLNLENGNILFADFSENTVMETVDITNLFHAGPFCAVNFTSTPLTDITNEHGYTITHTVHGPGETLLEKTNIGSFLDFRSVGVDDYSELGKYFSGSISVDESSVACDNYAYRLLKSFPNGAEKYWPNMDTDNFYCDSPESMKGQNLVQAYRDGNFDALVIDISDNQDCPSYHCQCIEQPSKDTILVNCTDKGFKYMPLTMPSGSWDKYKIDLILAQNKIQHLEYRPYLKDLVNLDLSRNAIRMFDENAARELPESTTINIEDQQLSFLPVTLKDKDPKLYTFGDNPITCDCSNPWIGDWIRFKHGHGRLKCFTTGGVMAAENVHDYELGCRSYHLLPKTAIISASVVALTFIAIIIGLCYLFKTDITLLKRRFHRKRNNVSPSMGLYDVFISFRKGNDEVFSTVKRYLQPALKEAGYSMFVPCFDIITGDVDLQMIKAVNMSRNFVVVLCNGYAGDFETNGEFEAIWTSFTKNNSKLIVVINFDNLDSRSVSDSRIKALRRSKYCLDFLDRGSKLTSRLFNLLGNPVQSTNQEESEENCLVLQDISSYDDDVINNEMKEKPETVFDRLNRQKPCDCVYRVCYTHSSEFYQHQRIKKPSNQTVSTA